MKKGIIILLLSLLTISLFAASFELQYKCGNTAVSSNSMNPHFIVANKSGAAVVASTITVRYYYTKEGTVGEQGTIDYAQIGNANVSVTFQTGYIEYGFTPGAGTIANGATTGEVQSRINKTDWTNYDQSNDCSFSPTITSYTLYEKMTVYVSGVLVYGTPCGTTTSGPTPTITATSVATRTATSAVTATRTATSAVTATATTVVTATRTATSGATATRTSTSRTATATRTATTRTATATRTATTGATRTPTATATAVTGTGVITLLPATQTVAVNGSAVITAYLNSGTTQKIAAYGITLAYNSTILGVNTATGTSGVTAGADGFVAAVNPNTAGSLVICGFDANGKGPGTNLNLFNVTFTGKVAGTSSVTCTITHLVDGAYATIGTPRTNNASVTVQ